MPKAGMAQVVKVNLLGYKVSMSRSTKINEPKKLRSCTYTFSLALQIVEENYLCNEDCKQVEKSINGVSKKRTQCFKNL